MLSFAVLVGSSLASGNRKSSAGHALSADSCEEDVTVSVTADMEGL